MELSGWQKLTVFFGGIAMVAGAIVDVPDAIRVIWSLLVWPAAKVENPVNLALLVIGFTAIAAGMFWNRVIGRSSLLSRWRAANLIRNESANTDQVSELQLHLYVGNMRVSTDYLETELHLDITIIAFNACDAPVHIRQVRGQISYSKVIDGKGKPVADLPPPRLDDRVEINNISPFTEFLIKLEQRVPPEVAREILRVSESERVHLNLENLNILLSTQHRANALLRLPLWDGITLYRDSTRIHVSENRHLKVKRRSL